MSSTIANPDDQRTGGSEVPSAESVRSALDRILASSDFIASDRARRFLKYIVEETLCGRSEGIKGLSVAIAVFDRDADFDAQNDPTVRVIAGRLRRALEHYYLLSGKDDPVVIDIPKGGYIPSFATRHVPAPAPVSASGEAASSGRSAWLRRPVVLASAGVLIAMAATAGFAVAMLTMERSQPAPLPAGPNLLVLPFEDLGGGDTSTIYAAALTDEIVTALANYKEITVFGIRTSRSVDSGEDVADLKQNLNAAYVLEGSVRSEDERMFVTARLLDTAQGAILWSRKFDNPFTAAGLYSIPSDTAGEVASAIAQPYGIVVQAESNRTRSRPPDDLDAYLCTLQYYGYRPTPDPEKHAAVRDCLERTVSRFPRYATAWALLGLIYLDEARHALNRRDSQGSAIDRALNASREAVRLDYNNARALQSLATTLFYARRVDEALGVGERAIALTPNDGELLGQMGQLFGLAGRLEEGRALLEQAIARNPARSAFFRGTLALVAYMQFDYDTAMAEIVEADVTGLPIYHGIAAMIYAQKGLDDRARASAAEFQRLQPDFVPNLWAELDIRNIPFPIQLHVADGFRKAGMEIPPPPAGRGNGTSAMQSEVR